MAVVSWTLHAAQYVQHVHARPAVRMVACDSWVAVGKPEPHALPCTITGRECTARTAVFLPSSCLSCLLASLRIGLTQLHDACVRCRCVRRNLTLSRYTGKVYSLLVSNFRHVLLIDADSMPVQVRVSVWGGRGKHLWAAALLISHPAEHLAAAPTS